jgi:hypothetical protein
VLLAKALQELEVLSVPGAHLKHDARRPTGGGERAVNLVYLPRVGYLHRDDADAALTGRLEHPAQACRP